MVGSTSPPLGAKEQSKIKRGSLLFRQLKDLLWILTTEGLPSEKQTFLINGDMVDRGPQQVEVILTVYLLFLVFPDAVMISRQLRWH